MAGDRPDASPALVAAGVIEPPGVSSRVEVVRVDVAVTDRHGRPVPDLTSDDFEIREDAAPRAITNFTYVAVGATVPAPAARPSTAGAPATEPVAPPAGRTRQRRVLAFVIDDLNRSRTSVARTRNLLVRFVQRSLQPDDLVGLFRTGAVPSTVVTLGADGARLLTEIAGLKWNGQSGRERPVDPIQEGRTAPVTIGKHLDRRRAFLLAEASPRPLAPDPGRRAVRCGRRPHGGARQAAAGTLGPTDRAARPADCRHDPRARRDPGNPQPQGVRASSGPALGGSWY